MQGFLLLIGLSLLFLIYLSAESFVYTRRIKRINLRITVSGTRGKTSIVRTLAAVFSEHGVKTLAKTTGSEAMYILPDGSSEPVRRKGLTTILEQKKLITRAVDLGVECIITEIMSIHPDNHKIETHKLIRPSLTILSNFRSDHTDVTGDSIREISELFVNDIFPGSTLIIPDNEINDFITAGIGKNRARLVPAKAGISRELKFSDPVYLHHMQDNLDCVVTTARYLGISDPTIIKGVENTPLDIGQLEIFRYSTNGRKVWFVNAFAANDPLSTRQIIEKTITILAPEYSVTPEIVGLFSLRSDRGERSRQWLDYLKRDEPPLFNRIFVSGIHSHIFTRKLKNCQTLTSKNPAEITRLLLGSTPLDAIIFGVANIHGLGEKLITYWKTEI